MLPLTLLMALVLSSLSSSPVHAAKLTERSKQKLAAEAARSAAQEKLQTLRRDIGRTETARSHAADALATSEAAISSANRTLRELALEQSGTEARLQALASQQQLLRATIELQQTRLAKMLREQQSNGNEDRLKLILSGDNPSRIYRDLQLLAYVSQAQARLIDELRANLQSVQENQAETQSAKDDLDEIVGEAREQKIVLEREKGRHAKLLNQLSGKLTSQRKEVGNIERDEQRLARLVDDLSKLIEEQQKAEQIERARQKKLAEERLQKEQALQAERSKNKTDKRAPEPMQAKAKPAPAAGSAPLTNELSPEDGPADGAFAALRGKLRLPVKGTVSDRFGSKRSDGPAWKGVFIRVAEGTEIKAVAKGKVVFADWLRGFGNLLILDHGNQYITIYGNNQAVLKHVGDVVKAGDAIASAGISGGNEQSGLYFEMRHQGRAFDPLEWVTLK